MIDDRFDRLASLFLGDHEPTPTEGMEAMMGRAAAAGGEGTAGVQLGIEIEDPIVEAALDRFKLLVAEKFEFHDEQAMCRGTCAP